MQSGDSHKLFSRLTILVVVILSLYVLYWLAEKAAPTVKFPDEADLTASSSSTTASSMDSGVGFAVSPQAGLPLLTIKAPKGAVNAMLASSSGDQERGLGGLSSLPDGYGMLFPFASPGDYGFWMKDMHFPIDMVWILSNKKVAGVTRSVSPDTYPSVFFPPLAISYVLELDSGGADRFGIATGTKLVF